MSNYFENKKVWIIGASSGIGKALAMDLSKLGAKLILSARSEDTLNSLNEQLGEKHIVRPVDVSDFEVLEDIFHSALEEVGHIDIAIFLAGIYQPMQCENLDIGQTKKIIEINLLGAFNFVKSVTAYYKSMGKGQIVLCGSLSGYRGLAGGQPYSATKAGLINLAESLKGELSKTNIKVQLVNPGFVKTRLTDKNDFEMPGLIEVEEASKSLIKGLKSNKFEIVFPKGFSYFMKFIRIIPSKLFFWISRKYLAK